MSVQALDLRCPECGAPLPGGQQDAYSCGFCGAETPHTALVTPPRTPLTKELTDLWRCVTGDFDNDGWLEVCGWFEEQLHAIDPVDETVLWTAFAGTEDEHALFTGPARIYTATEQGQLHALNAYTGQRVWSVTLSDVVRAVHDPGHVAGGVIFAVTGDERFYVLDRASGAVRTRANHVTGSGSFLQTVGERVVERFLTGIRIWSPERETPLVVNEGSSLDELTAELGTIGQRAPQFRSVDVMKAGAHRGLFYAVLNVTGPSEHHVEAVAYRLADGELVARRVLPDPDAGERLHESSYRDAAVIKGRLVFIQEGEAGLTGQDDKPGTLHLVPEGPSRPFPEDPDYETTDVYSVGEVIIAALQKTRGQERNALAGLDPTTLETIWQLDDVGSLYGPPGYSDERFVYQLGVDGESRLVGIDPGSGATLWEATRPRDSDERLDVSHGLVVHAGNGTTLLAETGEQLFPLAGRARGLSLPARGPGAPPPSEELPPWTGLQQAPRPAAPVDEALAGRRRLVVIIGALVLLAVGALIAFMVWGLG